MPPYIRGILAPSECEQRLYLYGAAADLQKCNLHATQNETYAQDADTFVRLQLTIPYKIRNRHAHIPMAKRDRLTTARSATCCHRKSLKISCTHMQRWRLRRTWQSWQRRCIVYTQQVVVTRSSSFGHEKHLSSPMQRNVTSGVAIYRLSLPSVRPNTYKLCYDCRFQPGLGRKRLLLDDTLNGRGKPSHSIKR